jgi:hypothetical protein
MPAGALLPFRHGGRRRNSHAFAMPVTVPVPTRAWMPTFVGMTEPQRLRVNVMCGWPPAGKGFSRVLVQAITCGHVSGL